MIDDLLPIPPLKDVEPDHSYGRYRIAMVINGLVHQVMILDAPDAAKYLSEPIFIQIPRTLHVVNGDTYDNGKFFPRD